MRPILPKEEYTITAFSENAVGLLNRITLIFTRRNINIESLTVSVSALKGIHKFTIVVNIDNEQAKKIVKHLEKQVDVLKAFCHTNKDIVFQELALYKVTTDNLLENRDVEKMVRKYGARILEITKEYTAIELTGTKQELIELYEDLATHCGVLQFTTSGRIAIHRESQEILTDFLTELDQNYGKKISRLID